MGFITRGANEGLCSATTAWWWQRLSGVLLLLLGVWWLGSLGYLGASDYRWVRLWVQQPAVSLALWLWIVILTSHAGLGLHGVIEDYTSGVLQRGLRYVLTGLLLASVSLATAFLGLIQWG